MTQPVIEHRRTLHQIPEVGFDLPKTLSYLHQVLSGLHCTLSAPIEGSLCAYFHAKQPDTIAFRADMDALPLQEVSAVEYCSTHPNKMHACGHDGHMAMALSLAEYVSQTIDTLPHNVLIFFQPAEESPGGAQPMCESGFLAQHHVKYVFGVHLWPNLEQGTVFTCPGPMMAQGNEIDVTFKGKSVHLSRSEQGHDALVAGSIFLSRAYQFMDSLDPSIPRKLRFGKMESGSVRNAISGHTLIEGSLRTYDQATFQTCKENLQAIGQAVAQETGCQCTVYVRDGYPPVWNHEGLYQQVMSHLGHNAPAFLDSPSLASEDFAFYQQQVPAIFFYLGLGQTPELHATNFHFDDEAVLPQGVAFLKSLLLLP